MGEKQPSVRRARRQMPLGSVRYVVTWDVDSGDRAMCGRVRRFVFGTSVTRRGKAYDYPGFVKRDGVRYLGQSVLLVPRPCLGELKAFLARNGVPHHVFRPVVRSVLRS